MILSRSGSEPALTLSNLIVYSVKGYGCIVEAVVQARSISDGADLVLLVNGETKP